MAQNQQATAELVGDREVLIKGKALGEARLIISTKDGHDNTYRVMVQAELLVARLLKTEDLL